MGPGPVRHYRSGIGLRALFFGLIAVVSACSCGPNSDAGLLRSNQIAVPFDVTGSPHLMEMVKTSNGLLVVANTSNILFYRDDAKNSLKLVGNIQPPYLRCVTLALHEPSNTAFCGAIDFDGVVSIDLPTMQLRHPVDESGTGHQSGFRQIFVHGSFLYLAGIHRGLLRRPILEGGELGPVESILDGDVVGVAGDGAALAVLDRNSGLVVLQPANGLDPVFTLPLDGPPVSLKVHGSRATIAMGSKGAIVVDLEARKIVAEVHPPTVVFSADSSDTLLAVGCSTAALLYDLTDAEPRLFGYDTAVFGFTEIRVFGETVLGGDWRLIDVYNVNRQGRVLQVDVLAGLPIDTGTAASLLLQNLGASPLETDQGVTVPAGGTASWKVPVTKNVREDYLVSTEDEPQRGREVQIIRNPNTLKLGDTFPIEATSSYVTFIVPDCALQWPALEDLLWLSKHGGLPGSLQPLIITLPTNDGDPFQVDEFPTLWDLEMKTLQSYFPGPASMQTFMERFSKTDQINGADTTSDWSIGADGHVLGFDRIYRGMHPLR